MIRLISFVAIVSTIALGGMLLAGAQASRAVAGPQDSACQTIVIQPDAAYGLAKTHQIRVCR